MYILPNKGVDVGLVEGNAFPVYIYIYLVFINIKYKHISYNNYLYIVLNIISIFKHYIFLITYNRDTLCAITSSCNIIICLI